MNNYILHTAASRGKADHGWLKTFFSFSFASYYDPEKVNFGVLRVLNDDVIAPKMGFGTHPHDNMEIISIGLKGEFHHEDNMGNTTIIKAGDIQVMSAGSGIEHSEKNKSLNENAELLQIWIFPNKKNVTPRYDQLATNANPVLNTLVQILSPNSTDEGVWIHQNCWFYLGTFLDTGKTSYTLKVETNGLYLFVIEGSFTINGHLLNKRDALGLWDITKIDITALSDNSKLLIMEIPMSLDKAIY